MTDRPLRVFRLRVVDADHPLWSRSTHNGNLLAYAQDEHEARDLATAALCIAGRSAPASETPVNPWRLDDLVSCTEIRHMGGDLPSAPMVMPTD